MSDSFFHSLDVAVVSLLAVVIPNAIAHLLQSSAQYHGLIAARALVMANEEMILLSTHERR